MCCSPWGFKIGRDSDGTARARTKAMDVCVQQGAFVDVNQQIATKILTVVFTSEVMSELGEGKGDFCVSFHVCANLLQLCLALCDPMDRGTWQAMVYGVTKSHMDHMDHIDHSLSGSSVHGILQANILCGLPCSPLEDLSDSEIKLTSLMSPALASGFFTTSAP